MTVGLRGLGTAVPPHTLPQDAAEAIARRLLGPRHPQFERLAPSFATSGVTTRYSVVPLDWFDHDKSWPARSAAYLHGATALFAAAARAALADAGLHAAQVDTVVTVSSTGIATPTLDARAAAELGFRPDVQRVPVFGLGCAGGVAGLGVARQLAQGAPGSTVLMVAVEACTLAFRTDRVRKADVIAAVLFGDGAAAAVLSTDAPGLRLGTPRQVLWPDTLSIMGWEVDETGFGVVFDRAIPDFVTNYLRAAADRAVAPDTPAAFDRFVCHPGGARVVEAIEGALSLPAGQLGAERAVLRDYGNMSAPTVLFVLARVLADGARGRMMLTALGPGFTGAFLPLEVT